MSCLDLNNDVQAFIAEHLSSDYESSTVFMSKHYDVQKKLFGEIVFHNDFHNIKTTPGRMKDDDDFKHAKIYKIYKDTNHIL